MALAIGSAKTSEINMAPLIDVLLVLLVIFMVVAPSQSKGLDSAIPQGIGADSKGLSPSMSFLECQAHEVTDRAFFINRAVVFVLRFLSGREPGGV
jgi:biopolymer transport protein ExbD